MVDRTLPPGKLPAAEISVTYDLEYGTDTLCMHEDALDPGEKVIIVDDLLATGGTALATIKLVEQVGGDLVGCSFIVDLPDLGGSKKIRATGHDVHFLCEFEGG